MAAVRGLCGASSTRSGNWHGLSCKVEHMDDPHQCLDCHEEPDIHAELFGINCARCHNTATWKPAVLTKHVFPAGSWRER